MPLNILVVDDEPEIIDMTRSVLLKRGFDVSTATNGLTALEAIEKARPDLILLDVLMPEMDGYTFYKQLKSNLGTRDIPVLIITGRGKMEDSFKVLGVDGFITKPFPPDRLIQEIELVLGIADTRRKIGGDAEGRPPKKVLAVGPSGEVLASMAAQARKAGCEVETVRTGAETIAKAVKIRPDLIFIDVQLDDMSSLETVQVLRRLPQLERTPIVGYAYYDTEDLARTEVRRKVLNIDAASAGFLSGGGTFYLGRYGHQAYIKALADYLKTAS